jgi:hypothetical protein
VENATPPKEPCIICGHKAMWPNSGLVLGEPTCYECWKWSMFWRVGQANMADKRVRQNARKT